MISPLRSFRTCFYILFMKRKIGQKVFSCPIDYTTCIPCCVDFYEILRFNGRFSLYVNAVNFIFYII